MYGEGYGEVWGRLGRPWESSGVLGNGSKLYESVGEALGRIEENWGEYEKVGKG